MAHPYKKLELFCWSVLPCAIALALALFYVMPKHVNGLGSVMPVLPLMAVYFWGTATTREMPYWFVFLLGLVIDTVGGMPLGVSSLSYVFFLGLLHAQRKYIHKEGFVIKWAYLAMLLAAMMLVQWLLLFLFYSQALGIKQAAIQWLLTLCIYPLFHMLFRRLAAHIAQRRWKLEHIR